MNDTLTFPEAIFCDFFWIIAFLICLPSLKRHSAYGRYFFLWLFIAIYSTFEFTGGDFYNYLSIYHQNLSSRYESIHIEYIYYWLINNLPHNYFIWRFAVWGLAGLFWILTVKNLHQPPQFAGLIFLLIVFFLFVGARQALCFSVLYFALSVLLKKDKPSAISITIFISLIICSYFLHKTAIVYILLMLIAFLPIGKKTLILSLILFPVLYKIFDLIAFSFISEYSAFNEESSESMERYMEGESQGANINGILRLTIDRLPIFLLLLFSIWKIHFKKESVPKIYSILLSMSYIMIYISYLFVGRDISKFIAPRFWDAALFPLTLFITGYMYNKRTTLFFKICIYLLLLSKFYTFAYTIYKL